MANWELLLTDARIATMCAGKAQYGAIEDGAIAISNGSVAWIGSRSELPQESAAETRSLALRWITPALIDCHTHLIFGGNRAEEFEQRLQGTSYEEIARTGGGIMSTVSATRAADFGALYDTAMRRLNRFAAGGVATVEIKSGYGLDVKNELKILAVARNLKKASALSLQTTLLAAHAVPPEFHGKADRYIDLICEELLPDVAENHLADAVDAYCATIAFDVPQIARMFRQAQKLGLPVKLHADQLTDGGGAELAAHFNALSADHLEYTTPAGVAAMAKSGTVAVLLPGAFLTLGETQLPPIELLRSNSVPIAIATDCNPGTSPLCSLREAMALACRLFRLTPEECLAGATREAARALGLAGDRGTLAVGKRADIAIWDIDHPRELSYWLGTNQLSSLLVEGRDVSLTGS
ncbi:MAG: imidazolonepropionase [Proteobacteria bacterium]|nr:imidazolonepropionase [Pseudomonadota bacterium]